MIVGTHADEYAQWRYTKTKTNINPNIDPNRYRRRCPDPNARIQKFIGVSIHKAGPVYRKQLTERTRQNKYSMPDSNYIANNTKQYQFLR